MNSMSSTSGHIWDTKLIWNISLNDNRSCQNDAPVMLSERSNTRLPKSFSPLTAAENIQIMHWEWGAKYRDNWQVTCVTQLRLLTVNKLSSFIICCLSVSEWVNNTSVTPNEISTFFKIYTGLKALYRPCTTKYQAVPTYNEPVPPGTS